MRDPDLLRARNRRTGVAILVIFLVLTAIAVTFVILRKHGLA